MFCFSHFVVNTGLLGHGPGVNMNNMNNMQMPMNGGFPPNKPPGPHFNHPPPPPPHGHGPPPFNPGGPRMMGPPPGPQGRGADNGNYWGDDSMRGGPHRGGHFHRGRGRGGDPGFRGRGGRGGPRGGHNSMGGKFECQKHSFPNFQNKLETNIQLFLSFQTCQRGQCVAISWWKETVGMKTIVRFTTPVWTDHLFLLSTDTNALKSSSSLNSPLVGKRTQNEPRVQGLNLTRRNSTMWRGMFASVTAQSHLLPPSVQLLHRDLNINSFFSILHRFPWSGKLGEDPRSSMKSQTVTINPLLDFGAYM